MTRIASALVLLAVALFALRKGGIWFGALALLAGLVMSAEWVIMSGISGLPRWISVGVIAMFVIALATGFHPDESLYWIIGAVTISAGALIAAAIGMKSLRWLAAGISWIWIPAICMVWLRDGENGLHYVLWLFLIVWGTDIGGYFVGRMVGGAKLAPRLSPNKTWAGFYGGIALAVLAGVLLSGLFQVHRPGYMAIVSIAVSIISQLGDISESAAKRHFGVKDSGRTIPGHGGLMDRLDGILFAAPAMALIRVFA